MSIGFLRRTGFVFVIGLVFANAFLARGQGEGIFAEFNTSMGSFTCRLEYAYAPKAVANFIGLATGQKAWLDLNTGALKNEPYYNGILFHRIAFIANGLIIQSGSRNGQGTDSPGYAFVDEFTPNLRYGSAGVLGMANSGTNSNGAQFFITLAPESTLNDHYTIFGELTGGTNVVSDISRVGTFFFNQSPTNPIVLLSVQIRRVGAAAEAFEINAQGLPVVTSQPLVIANAGSNQVSLTFSNRIYTENFLFTSSTNFYVPGIYTNVYVTTNYFTTNVVAVTNSITNVVTTTNVVHRTNVYTYVTNITTTNYNVTNIPLTSLYATNIYPTNLAVWSFESLGIEVPNFPITNTFNRTRDLDSKYFRLAEIVYPPIYVPRNLLNRTLTLNFDDDLGTIVINFDGANGGTYIPPPTDPPGTINYEWNQSLYQGALDPINYSYLLPMSLTFFFNSPSNGVFNGTVNSAASYTVTGSFILN
jgi:peptidyl-prolyl cis-trans isomerase A (cyclophilin A)